MLHEMSILIPFFKNIFYSLVKQFYHSRVGRQKQINRGSTNHETSFNILQNLLTSFNRVAKHVNLANLMNVVEWPGQYSPVASELCWPKQVDLLRLISFFLISLRALLLTVS